MNREWMKEVDQSLRELQQRTRHLPARFRAGGAGGGSTGGWVTAASFDTLPDASGVSVTTQARITAGDQIGQTYKVDPAGTGWRAVDECYFATTKAGLTNNTYVQRQARGFVTAGTAQGVVYVRNPANDGWVAINQCE